MTSNEIEAAEHRGRLYDYDSSDRGLLAADILALATALRDAQDRLDKTMRQLDGERAAANELFATQRALITLRTRRRSTR